VRTGDRVGLWAPNRYEWLVIQYATARIGAILVTINPAYKAAELRYALTKTGVSLLVLARGFRQADYVAMVGEVRAECPLLREALVLEDAWEDLLADGHDVAEADLEAIEATLEPGDPINVQFTSGTTGAPKGATLSHRNILNNGYFTGRTPLRYSEDDRVCVPVPFYHCFGMVVGNLACLTHGACLVVPGASLRTGIMAGAPCPVEVMTEVRSRMHMDEVTIACGMTENAPLSTQTAVDDAHDKRVTTVGRVHPHVEVKIVDPETGETATRGTPGEQCTRGYSVMLGYWNDEGATREAIDDDGWMHSGDLATMDDEGYVMIVGRIKDMLIRGGENIYPREVEEFLVTIPDVSDAYVIGVPSARYGEEVMAWVRLREASTLGPEELTAACRGQIASFKIPRYWKLVDHVPMTITGKVQKFVMREMAAAQLAGV
jgi:fatty-acyl-CoA synthase